MKNYIKYVGIVLAVVVLGLLVGCSGGSGGDDVVVVEEKVVVEVSPEDTLEGVVGDNGVRIDVAEYIVANYDDEATQDALMQYVKAGQAFVLSDGNETLAVEAAREIEKGTDCLYSMYEMEEVWKITEEAQLTLLNTKERMRAYLVADSLLGGHTFWSTPDDELASMCE